MKASSFFLITRSLTCGGSNKLSLRYNFFSGELKSISEFFLANNSRSFSFWSLLEPASYANGKSFFEILFEVLSVLLNYPEFSGYSSISSSLLSKWNDSFLSTSMVILRSNLSTFSLKLVYVNPGKAFA